MTTLRLVSHYIFTFRKKTHPSGTREGRDRYAKGAARTRGGEGFLQGGCGFLLSSAPRCFATRSLVLLRFAFSRIGNCKWLASMHARCCQSLILLKSTKCRLQCLLTQNMSYLKLSLSTRKTTVPALNKIGHTQVRTIQCQNGWKSDADQESILTDFLLLGRSAGMVPLEMFWILTAQSPLSWVSESFRQDIYWLFKPFSSFQLGKFKVCY